MDNIRGLYRTAGFAFVADNSIGFDIPETEYRECGYTSDYGGVPSKEGNEANLTSKRASQRKRSQGRAALLCEWSL